MTPETGQAGCRSLRRERSSRGGVAVKLVVAVVALIPVAAFPANAAITHGGGNPADASAARCGTQTTPVAYQHIIVIMDENLGWSYNPASYPRPGSISPRTRPT